MKSNQDRLEKFGEEIDATLKLLNEAQPSTAMVSRIHRSLETAATSRPIALGRRILIPAIGVVMAALVLVAIFTRVHRTPENQASVVETARVVATVPLARAMIMPPSVMAATGGSRKGKQSVRLSMERRSRQKLENRHATNLLSYPLTRQEKLLLQFAHNAKPADLQALNPEYQAKVEAQQEAEFAAYLKSHSRFDTTNATQTKDSTQE